MSDWITTNGMKRGDVGRRVGVAAASTWSRMLSGQLRPDADVVERARQLTGGAVGPNDWHAARLDWLRANGHADDLPADDLPVLGEEEAA